MSTEERIQNMIAEMTLEEKVSQMLHDSPAIQRLGIPRYNWWNECLHGVARAGVATIFPQAIALAATFDKELVREVAEAISDEVRAKYNESTRAGVRAQYYGLTCWAPNVNIFRDPRWGRGQETYGEDPNLTATLGTAFMKGLQGEVTGSLKVAACAKHFAVHSGPEGLRHNFNAQVGWKDLYETYLPAFKALVDQGVEAVMGAYNQTLGEPCCGSTLLIKGILRGEWKFAGHFVSDCWAIRDFHQHYGVTSTVEESAALALNAGCDLNCGCSYSNLVNAVEQGLVKEETIDESLTRLLRTRFKLGMFNPPGDGPYDHLSNKVIRCERHLDLALESAHKSIVLLKNEKDLLPLKGNLVQRILLIGPCAANLHTLLGNYHGLSPRLVTILEGLTEKIQDKPGISLNYHQGCLMHRENRNTGWTVGMAEAADVVIAVFGIDGAIEGEEGDAIASEAKGDRTTIELPDWQLAYLRSLRERKTPIVLILTGGSPVIVPDDIADAVLFIWYPGERGGTAVADILFGDVVPSGKLPVTFPVSTEQLPPFEDYTMEGRTYRFLRSEPQYPFGFGLSYSRFSYLSIRGSDERLSSQELTSRGFTVEVEVKNHGPFLAEEVVQLYMITPQHGENTANFSLCRFQRIALADQTSQRVKFLLTTEDFESVDQDGRRILLQGEYEITVASCAPFRSAVARGATAPLSLTCLIE